MQFSINVGQYTEHGSFCQETSRRENRSGSPIIAILPCSIKLDAAKMERAAGHLEIAGGGSGNA